MMTGLRQEVEYRLVVLTTSQLDATLLAIDYVRMTIYDINSNYISINNYILSPEFHPVATEQSFSSLSGTKLWCWSFADL